MEGKILLTDKERILTHIIRQIYPRYIFGHTSFQERFESSKSESIKKGDLVLGLTSGSHEYTIGYAIRIFTESEMILREIGSKRTCRIGNEMFYRIPMKILSKYELLEGLEYITYTKIHKALRKAETKYSVYFHSLDFDDGICIVNLREKWKDEIYKTFEFKYSSKTTIKEIVNLIES